MNVEQLQSWLKVIAAFLGPAVTFIGFYLVILNLRLGTKTLELSTENAANAQKWKQAEFLYDQIKIFRANESVRRAIKMCDWSLVAIEAYAKGDKREYVAHDEASGKILFDKNQNDKHVTILSSALSPKTIKSFSIIEERIREDFDELFYLLTAFCAMIDSKLIDRAHFIKHISYELDLLGGRLSHAAAAGPIIEAYCSKFGFRDALDLIKGGAASAPM